MGTEGNVDAGKEGNDFPLASLYERHSVKMNLLVKYENSYFLV